MTDQQTLQPQAPQPQPQPQPMQPQPQAPQPMQPQPQAPQPTQPHDSAAQSIIEQLHAQNAALIEQNNNLNEQVLRMLQSGAQFTQYQPQQQPQQPQPQQPPVNQYGGMYSPFNQGMQAGAYPPVYMPGSEMPASLTQDVDLSLESLASEIGKKEQ